MAIQYPGPYVRGDAKVEFINNPSVDFKFDGIDVNAEITDLYTNGYNGVSPDDVTVTFDYDTRDVEDDYDLFEEELSESKEVTGMVKKFIADVNKYLKRKWEIINSYCRSDLIDFENDYLPNESEGNGLVFKFEYDDNGNPIEYVGYQY